MKNQKDFNTDFVNNISLGSSIDEKLLGEIKPGIKLEAKRALEVYQEDYQARLTEALKNTYKAIHLILGDEDFNQLAKSYIKTYFSKSPNLDDYGEDLSTFIQNKQLYKDYPFLSELADFEWKFRLSFHLESIDGLDAYELEKVLLLESSLIQLSPFVFMIDYQYSISEIYQYALIDHQEESAESMSFHHSQYLLMFKGQKNVQITTLTKNQWHWTKQLINSINLNKLFHQENQNISADELRVLFQIFADERLLITLP